VGGSAYRRVGVSACGRVGVWAGRRVGGSACGRVGVWACRRVGVSAGWSGGVGEWGSGGESGRSILWVNFFARLLGLTLGAE